MTEEEILQLAENHLIFEKHNDVWKTDTLQLLKFARAIIEEHEKDPVKQILNDPNDELNRLIARIPTEGAIAMAEPIRKALEALPND
jgi:hypothetical protein